MSNRSDREYAALIKARQDASGRFGFILGCLCAVTALSINLWRTPRPWSWQTLAVAALMAALNVPIGIALGLMGERMTRPPRDGKR
jgi:hypothetical protein